MTTAVNATVGLIAEQYIADAGDRALFLWVVAAISWALVLALAAILGARTLAPRPS